MVFKTSHNIGNNLSKDQEVESFGTLTSFRENKVQHIDEHKV